MRVLSLIAVAAALASSVSASKAAVFNTYTVSCQTTYIVQNGDTVRVDMDLIRESFTHYLPSSNLVFQDW